ncbi:hypothetical protein HYC85_031882 [Camellia sinensis]|uniref:DUF7895 domain-containing protein n=1 Tax=Camellia sinensis TaxID=4442 RepID=A0A7J7FRX4_CAMSI|nr:hypothetical protein HYC85_031882 [Camellia sinensis]
MELTLQTLSFAPFPKIRDSKLKNHRTFERNHHSASYVKSKEPRRKISVISSSLLETAASVAVAATVVGTAATLLVRRTKASEETEVGLPKKWSYCTKCSSARSCTSCGGRGKIALL